MIIQPKIRGFICTTAHPEGCARHVQEQIEYVKSRPKQAAGPKKVLVIGASTGYGLASRIAATFGSGAATIGVFFEKPASGSRTASAGWYNTAAFEQAAQAEGYYATSLNGDAFSDELKQQTIARIREDLGQVDLVVYSLASPRRTHPRTGETFTSVIKPIGAAYTNKTVDVHSGKVSEITVEPATEEEVRHTVAIMGGEDWIMWMDALQEAGVLAEGVQTVAYSYIGPSVTHAIYREGTIGRAKDDLEKSAHELNGKLSELSGKAYVSVNKALVTQSSAAIPIVPLYISLLYKVMKEKNLHEGCIEQMVRLFEERLYTNGAVPVDEKGRIRVDDLEMREDVQQAVADLWGQVTTDNLESISDIAGYRSEFLRLFGFGLAGIDYEAETEADVAVPTLSQESK
ncbi:trans-2-enoyl-CoA reductase family protein [Xylanibacillus composti]|uniref:Trans-2-enoyl-CoA reductase [NADH] n=1 Tax=Xylanibacillus composti TaxID=1572762 RepID=A0A8J4H480_9BACL|nr:enoyl-ACP reductase FabV [Xylanibacillus composti]MDT9724285.1 trans-2-enoyl-CoA reductase family protein [Xylanibacillus composti]GIQ69281.1 enoyl-[acyl-carrier-protein] reductase [NADH] [Xylanibacillus composti]